MREIKFRAWDEEGKKMIYWTLNDLLVRFNTSEYDGNDRPSALFDWMQYTGLKDVNEKEVYEGDIVRDVSNSDLIFEIKWHDDNLGYYMPREYDDEYSWTITEPDLEVIGNIYENPELLTNPL